MTKAAIPFPNYVVSIQQLDVTVNKVKLLHPPRENTKLFPTFRDRQYIYNSILQSTVTYSRLLTTGYLPVTLGI